MDIISLSLIIYGISKSFFVIPVMQLQNVTFWEHLPLTLQNVMFVPLINDVLPVFQYLVSLFVSVFFWFCNYAISYHFGFTKNVYNFYEDERPLSLLCTFSLPTVILFVLRRNVSIRNKLLNMYYRNIT